MKRYISLSVLALAVCTQVRPFTVPDLIVIPTALAGGVGAAYKINKSDWLSRMVSNLKDRSIKGYNIPTKDIAKQVATGVTGVCSYNLIHKLLHRYSPTGKMDRARKVVETNFNDPFIMTKYASNEEVLAYVEDHYFGSDWPLVETHQQLVAAKEELEDAIGLLQDVGNARTNFGEETTILKGKAMFAITIIKQRDEVIRTNDRKEYDRQFRRYQRDNELDIQQQQLAVAEHQLLRQTLKHY